MNTNEGPKVFSINSNACICHMLLLLLLLASNRSMARLVSYSSPRRPPAQPSLLSIIRAATRSPRCSLGRKENLSDGLVRTHWNLEPASCAPGRMCSRTFVLTLPLSGPFTRQFPIVVAFHSTEEGALSHHCELVGKPRRWKLTLLFV
jgi:hypothetical protein